METIICYGDKMFSRQCPHCNRFVKADEQIEYLHNDWTDEDKFEKDNATCSRCGRVKMEFLGYGEE